MLGRGQLEAATFGDAVLQHEVLTLFAGQVRTLLDQLAARSGEAAPILHTLKGSAWAVGAWRLARLAEDIETRIAGGTDDAISAGELGELARAVSEVQAAIRALTGPDGQPPA